MTSIILFNLVGVAVIAFIIWWFWLSQSHQETKVSDNQPIEIVVENGVYSPAIIRTKSNKEITLRFIRKDHSPCAEKVIFQDFDLSADLPASKSYDISFTPNKIGEFDFTCQMGMYRGKLIVE